MEMIFIHKYKSADESKRKALKKNINNYKWVKLQSKPDGILIGVVSSMDDEAKAKFSIPLKNDTSIDTTKFYLNGKVKKHQ